MESANQLNIEQKLGYQFHSKDLLEEALRHSSYVNEQSDEELRDNLFHTPNALFALRR